ncbi:Asp-tRNA(Asn)/Glu-tRNA(Gln) amidotransferase subunit GatB [Candidatus Poribacteria bacterium]|nr:MAG: Asp-tRNA(Asn)/Glu-tRNA(Gln) amidotransferase subunit GatB [Candidatus Poribacteria bacterium]
MATITTDDVQHVATLARLEFNEVDVEQFTHQLARILDYIGKLNELDTTDVPPTSHPLPLRNVVKEDVAKSSYDRDTVLEGAPNAEEGYFEVPKVIE